MEDSNFHREIIFIIDDDVDFCSLITETLASLGTIQSFQDPKFLFEALKKVKPSLILIDLNLNHPNYTGFDIVQEIHKRHDSHLIPMLMVSGADDVYSKALRSGIDDYIQKPIMPDLFVNKVEHILYQNQKKIYTNALTGLPDIHMVEREYLSRSAKKEAFSLAYLDIDNFKSFNDEKGVKAGDDAIQLIAQTCMKVRANYSKVELFVGHLGGDDFFLVGIYKEMKKIIQKIYTIFAKETKHLFTSEEINCGYYRGSDREGNLINIPLLSISTAIINFGRDAHQRVPFQNITEKSTQIKKEAKRELGNSIIEKMYAALS